MTAAIEQLIGGHDLLTAGKGKAGASLGFADFRRALPHRCAIGGAADRLRPGRQSRSRNARPAPIADQEAVQALLAALGAPAGAGPPHPHRRGRAQLGVEGDATALAEAKHWLAALGRDAEDEALFREQVALSTEADFWDPPPADRVSLLTMHAAKGLEFPVVFVVGVEDGLTAVYLGRRGGRRAIGGGTPPVLRRDDPRKGPAVPEPLPATAMARTGQALPPSPFLHDIAPDLVTHQAPERRRAKPQQFRFVLVGC